MIRFWKPFRVVLSLLVLLSIAFLFIDFRQQLPSGGYNAITFFQFVPSLRKFLIVAGFLSGGFILVTIITLLVGRVYCSVLCPLGILQDVISYFSRKFAKKKKFKYAKPKNWLRYGFLVLALIPLVGGSIFAIGLLDPYSNFGRIFSDLGRPVYLFLNNLVAELFIKMKIYSLAPQDLPTVHLSTLVYPVLVLGLLTWLAAKWGRLYCNTVCPVGAFLGILSRWSVFKIRIDQSSCTKCAKCAFVCKSQCISIKTQEVDFSRCVGCFNCLKSCDQESISYKFAWKPVTKSQDKSIKHSEVTDESKRNLIAGSLALALGFFGIAGKAKAEDKPELKYRDNLTPVKKTHPCSPPGSKSIEHFNDACTACHLCISACPNDVLQPSVLQYGLVGFLQPFMDPASGYCNFECTKCSEVCPNGAILPLTKEEKKVTQVGVVKFIKTNCVVYTDETVCEACSEHCPTKAVKMVPYKEKLNIPEVNTEICVGCGACEHACPVRPHRAIYVDGNAVHQVAKKPEVKKAKEEEIEEFPF